jgi:hypothetical protein
MTNGICDVEGCCRSTYMGWRPLTERIGRQICEFHWLRHRDEKDSFDLYDEFRFRRPVEIQKPVSRSHILRCSCGRELLPGRRFCTVCAAERKRQRKKRYYHGKKVNQAEPTEEIILKCKQCSEPRLPNHIYCSKCVKHRKIMTRRQAQSRYWKKRHKVMV